MTAFEETYKDAVSVSEQSSVRFSPKGGSVLYFDPFHVRTETHDADFVFLTHDHFDHYSLPDIRKVRKAETIFLLPETMVSAVAAVGADADHVILMKPGDKRVLYDLEIEAFPAYNVGKPFHPKANGWLGYRVASEGCALFVPGDTDVTEEIRSLKADLLFVPIGGKYTMDAEEAGEWTKRVSPQAAVPIHYGTVVGTPDLLDRYRAAVGDAVPVWPKLSF